MATTFPKQRTTRTIGDADPDFAQLETAATLASTYSPMVFDSETYGFNERLSSTRTPTRVAIVIGIGMLPFLGVAATYLMRPGPRGTNEINDVQNAFDYGVGALAAIVGGVFIVIRVVRGLGERA